MRTQRISSGVTKRTLKGYQHEVVALRAHRHTHTHTHARIRAHTHTHTHGHTHIHTRTHTHTHTWVMAAIPELVQLVA